MQDLNWPEIAERFNPLYSALVYDTLEEFGYPDQAISAQARRVAEPRAADLSGLGVDHVVLV